MNSKTKSALVLLGTLILGVVIGAMAWTTLHNKRVEEIRSLRERGRLSSVVEDVISPVDANQAAEIREIVADYEARLSAVLEQMHVARRAASDSMRARLTPLLSDEQATNFERWLERNRRPSRSNGRRDSTSRSDTN